MDLNSSQQELLVLFNFFFVCVCCLFRKSENLYVCRHNIQPVGNIYIFLSYVSLPWLLKELMLCSLNANFSSYLLPEAKSFFLCISFGFLHILFSFSVFCYCGFIVLRNYVWFCAKKMSWPYQAKNAKNSLNAKEVLVSIYVPY